MTNLARAATRGTLAYGSRADVPYGCGNVCAQAVLATTDPRTGRPSYAVRIANNSQHALRAVVRFGNRMRTPSSELEIAPFSIVESLVPHGALTRPDDRAIVEIRGTNLAFTIDAPPAIATKHLALRRTATIGGLAAAAGSLALAAVVALVQHTTGDARPSPTTNAPHPTMTLAAKPATRVAHAPGIRVGSSRVIAGGTLGVSYAPSPSGDVWLLDDTGRVWAHERTNVGGRTVLTIPENAAGRDLRVVVGTNANGELRQVASSIAVIPDATNLAPQDDPAPKSSATVTPTTVASGKAVTIRFAAKHGEALVSITDDQGSVIEQRDVPANVAHVSLQAPAAGAPTSYDVVISIARGNSQDQSIVPLTVTP